MENNENNNKRDNGGGGGGSRFSSFWIYGIIAVIFLGLNLVAMEGSQDPLPRNRLGQMLQNGDIEKIEVINKEVAQVVIKNRHSITIARKVKVKAEVLEVVIKTKKEEALEKK